MEHWMHFLTDGRPGDDEEVKVEKQAFSQSSEDVFEGVRPEFYVKVSAAGGLRGLELGGVAAEDEG